MFKFSTTSHYIEIPHDDYVADVAFGANNNFSISVWAYQENGLVPHHMVH